MPTDLSNLKRSTLNRLISIMATVLKTPDKEWFEWMLEEIEEYKAALRILDIAQERAASNRWGAFEDLLNDLRAEISGREA